MAVPSRLSSWIEVSRNSRRAAGSEAACGLVQYQEVGTMTDGADEGDLARLAFAELVNPGVTVEAEAFDQLALESMIPRIEEVAMERDQIGNARPQG